MIALYIIGPIILILLIYLIISSIKNSRSLFSSFVELYLYLTSNWKWFVRLPKSFFKFISKHHIENKKVVLKDKKIAIKEISYHNMQTFIINDNNEASNIIIYLHGGAYISNPTVHHKHYVKKLAVNTNSIVVFPIYPKTPIHNYKETFSIIDKLYKDIINNSKLNVILMGDSSGGGLALVLLEKLAKYNEIQPSKTILFSPWLDISLSSDGIESYEKVDPMLAIKPIRYVGEFYYKGTNEKDYKVSPLFGEISKIKNLTIFVGTREILYPETIRFKDRCEKEKVDLNLIIHKGMNHCYPLYPIKEAKTTNNMIYNIIKQK